MVFYGRRLLLSLSSIDKTMENLHSHLGWNCYSDQLQCHCRRLSRKRRHICQVSSLRRCLRESWTWRPYSSCLSSKWVVKTLPCPPNILCSWQQHCHQLLLWPFSSIVR